MVQAAAWFSDSVVGHINEVALRRARLVPGWVILSVCNSRRGKIYLGM